MSSFSLKRKILISLFVILNIGTVLFMNRPDSFINTINGIISSYGSSDLSYKATISSWYIKIYAHIVGLDNRWEMFGRQSRFNWWYRIKAKYANGEIITLPLPRQSPRNWFESSLIDFKEGKFHLNLYTRAVEREIYSRYLCRQFSQLNNVPIISVIFELHYQYILPPEEAFKQDKYIDPQVYSSVLNEFVCPGAK